MKRTFFIILALSLTALAEVKIESKQLDEPKVALAQATQSQDSQVLQASDYLFKEVMIAEVTQSYRAVEVPKVELEILSYVAPTIKDTLKHAKTSGHESHRMTMSRWRFKNIVV